MTSEIQETTSSNNNKMWIWLILGLILASIGGYFFLKNKAVEDNEKLFSTYYVQPAEIDNVQGAGPFRNKLENGYYLFSQDRFEDCLKKMKKVIKEDTRNKGHVSMAHYIRAHCYIHLKEYANAKKELKRSMHFGVQRQYLLIDLLEGKLTEAEYNEQKVIKK